MAELITSSQALRFSILFPRGVHSRVITLELVVPAGVGADDFKFSSIVGLNTWVLSIDWWIAGLQSGLHLGCFFQASTGTGEPGNSGVIFLEWTPLIPHFGIKPFPVIHWNDNINLHFQMNHLITGEARRFGVAMQNFSTTNQLRALIAIQFSEG